MFAAHEFIASSAKMTGRIEVYKASNITEAIAHVLYTNALKDGHSFVGPTGRVVYCGQYGYSVVKA